MAVPTTEPRPRPHVRIEPAAFRAATLGIVAFIASFIVPVDYDYWWHLADGRYILAQHTLPSPDAFSFTAAGRPLVAHEWLAEAPMYLLHQAFGLRGPLALFALCTVAVVLFTFSTLRRMGAPQSAILTCIALAAIWLFTGARPQVAGFALTAALLCLLERWIARRDRSIWALPVLVWLWGNLHGSFAIGLALPALILLGELLASWLRWRSATRLDARGRLQLAAAIAASLVLLLLTPNGAPLLLYPLSKLHDPLARQFIAEWVATDISDPSNWPFVLLAGGYAALVIVRRPELPASDLLLASVLTAAALSTLRYVPFAAIVLAVLVGRVLSQPNRGSAHTPDVVARLAAWRARRPRRRTSPSPALQALYLLALLTLAGAFVVIARGLDPMASARTRLPVAAVDTLGAGGFQGPLFNHYDWGGYLIWRLWPQTRVFIDGRGDMYIKGGEFRQYFDVADVTASADAVLDQYHIRTVLFPRDAALTRYLVATGRWRSTYDDGRVVRLERVP